jgi:hypothetical protein
MYRARSECNELEAEDTPSLIPLVIPDRRRGRRRREPQVSTREDERNAGEEPPLPWAISIYFFSE